MGAVSAYVSFLRRLGRPYLSAAAARLPIGMVPLCIVLLVQQVKGTYAAAGLVSGAFALAQALTGPSWGRALDRWGQSRVIAPASAVSAGLLVALATVTVLDLPVPVLTAVAAAAGLVFVPVTPATRGLFRAELHEAEVRHAAFSLDTSTVELIFVVGPLLVGLMVSGPAMLPLLVTAGVQLAGGLLYATAPQVRRLTGHGTARRTRPGGVPAADVATDGGSGGATAPSARLFSTALVLVVSVSALVSMGFGQLDVSVAAAAAPVLGEADRVGWLFACVAGGSAIGGLVYGARHWAHHPARALPVAVAAFTVGLVAVAATLLVPGDAAGRAPVLMVALFVTGLTIAPGLIMQSALVDAMVPTARLSEGQAWLNTAFSSGGALGSAVAGPLIDHGGAGEGFVGAAVAVAVAFVLAAVATGRLTAPVGAGRAGADQTGEVLPVPEVMSSSRP